MEIQPDPIQRYALRPNNNVVEEKNACDTLASHENPSSGELILGHASLLTSCLLAPDEKFIITADRDEHIRVSWYPEGYIIESYCLGHRKYVLLSYPRVALISRMNKICVSHSHFRGVSYKLDFWRRRS